MLVRSALARSSTSDTALADTLRFLRNLGMRQRYIHETIGTNARPSDVAAAIGRVQLSKLPGRPRHPDRRVLPHPIHRMPPYRSANSPTCLLHTGLASDQVPSLPVHPGLTRAGLTRIIDGIRTLSRRR